MKPLISFIVTYHNEPEAMLRVCVESIQALRLAEDEAEIIVVDDGSEVDLQLHDFTIPQLIRQEQAGLSVARNTGIDNAQGKYIQFVDADDCLIPSAYEAVIEQVRKEEADIMMFKMTTASPQSSSKERNSHRNSHLLWTGRGSQYLLHRNLRAAACGYVFKRDILGELRFFPGIFHEDELFTPLLFLRAGSLVELNVKPYFYRQHEGTITHAKSVEMVQKRLNDMHFIVNKLNSMNEPLLERKIRQLTADYLQKSWTQTRSFSELRRRIAELREEGFLPLPLHCYSPRYLAIAAAVNMWQC